MKKLLLSLFITFSAFGSLEYNDETKMFYSTKNSEFVDPIRYHIIAEYCALLLENALKDNIDLYDIIQHIKELLTFHDSIEADLLYDDFCELWF